MSKKNDLYSLGEAYGNILDGVNVVEEQVPVGEIGEADLVTKDTGPTEKGGFKEAEVDITKAGDKENKYNIKGLSYGDKNDPGTEYEGPEPTGKGNAYSGIVGKSEEDEEELEENEENSEETEKIAHESLNNFMAKKSVFDRLYDKVMVNENYGEMEEGDDSMEELDALGLDDADPDGAEGEVTITLDKDTAKTLHDLIAQQLEDDVDDVEDGGPEEFEDEEAPDSEEALPEEDEEGYTPMNTHYDDGKNNKVGNLKAKGGASEKGAGKKGVDPGSPMNTHYNDGKNNKVGNLKTGQSAYE